MTDYSKYFNSLIDNEKISDIGLIEKAIDIIAILQEQRNKFCNIAYNAITFAQLDEQYDKPTLLQELGATETEYNDIMEE